MRAVSRFGWVGALMLCGLLPCGAAEPQPVKVRQTEGLVHGFLSLRTMDGKLLAGGDLTQVNRGGRVTNRLTFRFKDGSLHEETAVYTQAGVFRLLSNHLVQKGPSFPRPMDFSLDATNGKVSVRYEDEHGKKKEETEQMKLPPGVSNGMVFTLLKNFPPGAAEMTVSMVAATPKPRLVKLELSRAGEEAFSVAGATHRAAHFVVKVEIGGLAGVLAPLLGKQPPDHHVWVIGGTAPGFVKAEGSLYLGGPSWRIELASPVWPNTAAPVEAPTSGSAERKTKN